MVRVTCPGADPSTAWRVRDALALHPLLSGAAARISVVMTKDSVVLEGWILDESLGQTALRLAMRAAGSRPVQAHLQVENCPVPAPRRR
jgi:osmotically-inducible protein OsmY